jgi:hypothetical protein
MRSKSLPLGIATRGATPIVHLHLIARSGFNSPERQLRLGFQQRHITPHRRVSAGKSLLLLKVLKDPLGRQSLLELLDND